MTARPARLAVTAVFFAHGALFGSWVARIPAVSGDLDLSEAELGIALFGTTLGALVGLPLAGWIVSREGSRATVVQGLPLFALLLPALALAPNLPLLFVALFAFGLAAGAVDVAMNAHGLAVEQRLQRPILSTLHAGWSFGGLVGAGAGALLAGADVGALPHFAGAALVIGVAGLAATRRLLPASADRPQERAPRRRPPGRLVTLAVLAFCGLFAEGAASDWSAVYISGEVGAGAGVAALGFAAFSMAMATFRLVGDRLTMRLGAEALMRGGGLLAAAGLAGADDVVATVTLSKSLGAQGGAVLGPAAVTAHLVDTARSFIFDTGLAPAAVGAAHAALAVLRAEPERPGAVLRVAAALADAAGVPAPPSAVVAVVLGDPDVAVVAARRCAERGLRVGCFRPPSVPEGTSRLRLTARATVTAAELAHVRTVLADVLAPANA